MLALCDFIIYRAGGKIELLKDKLPNQKSAIENPPP